MSKLGLDRTILSGITKNNQAIVALERVFKDVGETLPRGIEEAVAQAVQAIASANMALSIIAELASGVDQMLLAPALQPVTDADDYTPTAQPTIEADDFGRSAAPAVEPDDYSVAIHTGTLAAQDADAVDITGGTVGLDAGNAAAPSLFFGNDVDTGFYHIGTNSLGLASGGVFLVNFRPGSVDVGGSVLADGQLGSYVTTASGIPPLAIASQTLVPNLYVARAALADSATTAFSATTATSAGTANTLTSPTTYPPNATDLPSALVLLNAVKAANQFKGV